MTMALQIKEQILTKCGFCIIFLLAILTMFAPMIGGTNPMMRQTLKKRLPSSNQSEEECKKLYFRQQLDHFNFQPSSYREFNQKFLMDDRYWGGQNTSSPIFVYLEGEGPMHDYSCQDIGFMVDNVHIFKPLLVHIEHRYYGESVPFASRDEAFANATTLGYLSSIQALADAAELILSLKSNLSAQNSPVIVYGVSYAGMLAAWMRLKYPQIVLGSLASSAPLLYFENLTPHDGYYSVVSRDFKEVSETCYNSIKESWDEIDRVTSRLNGLATLRRTFNTCSVLNNSTELKNALEYQYCLAAQYGLFPIPIFCDGVDQISRNSSILDRINAGLVAAVTGGFCLSTRIDEFYSQETVEGWKWQTCSEMVMPIGRNNETMFYPNPFNLSDFELTCKKMYGVSPRPHWVTTYYGGENMKQTFCKFGSNIIFSNGLMDPYSSGGVLEDISDTIVALQAKQGFHGFDMMPSSSNDPEWLVKIKAKEVKIIESWLQAYYNEL